MHLWTFKWGNPRDLISIFHGSSYPPDSLKVNITPLATLCREFPASFLVSANAHQGRSRGIRPSANPGGLKHSIPGFCETLLSVKLRNDEKPQRPITSATSRARGPNQGCRSSSSSAHNCRNLAGPELAAPAELAAQLTWPLRFVTIKAATSWSGLAAGGAQCPLPPRATRIGNIVRAPSRHPSPGRPKAATVGVRGDCHPI